MKLKLALAALLIVALCAPTVGAAGSTGGDGPATAAKGCKKKKKGKAAVAKKKKKNCKGKKPPGGGAPPPVDPTGDTRITLTSILPFSVGQEEVKGTIASTNAACTSGRTLSLYEELGAVDQLRHQAGIFNGQVSFYMPTQSSGDDFYAVATQDTVGSVACAPGTSNVISKP